MALLRWVPTRGRLPASPRFTEDSPIPVLFVHGTLGSPGNFERPAQRLVEQGRPFFAPAYGKHGTASLDSSLQELLVYVDALISRGVRQVDIVGHSAGGLLALRIAHARPGFVRKLVGLGAAFHGVPKNLRFKPVVKWIGGQALLQLTQKIPAELPKDVELISVFSTSDFVVPAQSSKLGELVEIHGVRHEDLPRQADIILDALET
ncbi:alpha/beta fold hydrolase [Corynebacterium pseudotuberculosis]|uniref:alpha/beta fold hydrolase n=1 Tax=Corynebacterium pseudotuberculosis TaxID=1719 RepID=UPI00059DD823|nr:alpha/beta fold hydrolase [Corynebacterium pseudotuberculosis]AFM08040.3 alpha/beta fold hydrolase [Corynebacterium pseudotuberculosis Cp162]APG82443.1 Hypothetical protein CPI37_1824 [Corynebacterium pseudotuberculosis]WFP66862.1 alpha/beta fold hydrolase [Corynebacterium pseudotuberculosis]